MNIDKRIARLEKQLAEAKAEKAAQDAEDEIAATVLIFQGSKVVRAILKSVSFSVAPADSVMSISNRDEYYWDNTPELEISGRVVVFEERKEGSND